MNKGVNNHSEKINIQHLPVGIYIIKVYLNNTRYKYLKFIKK
ncbi:MAG: T9SS type A sorting domain-containing protein [Dysgonamonadaceae bacterium]|nr:T9SS type A sorting domain-containing protein [Dysgonamonadaceae bacterium]